LKRRELLAQNSFSPWRNSPQWTRASSLSRLHDHTQTHHTRQDSSRRVIFPSQRPLPDNTHHSQETDIHASGGIPTRNPSKLAAADPRLRPHGYWDSHTPEDLNLQTLLTQWSLVTLIKSRHEFLHMIERHANALCITGELNETAS
jgi:hypothetical protein